MEKAFENEYINVIFNDTTKILTASFKPASEFRTSEQMKKDVTQTTKMVEHFKPLYFLGNDKENKYPYKVDEQKWVANTFTNTFIKANIKKLAVIYPEELIAELALQQVIEEAGKIPFEIKYFYSEKEAIQWFNE